MDFPARLVVQPPSRRPHTHTVIFLHGRGDTARDLAEALHHFSNAHSRSLFDIFPSFRWVFPQAPLRELAASGDKSFQWFDVWDMTDPTEREDVQRDGLRESVARVTRLVRDEVEILGSWERVVVAGISQGGAIAVHTLLGLDAKGKERIGAVIGFSCRLFLGRETLKETRGEIAGDEGPEEAGEVLRDTPVLLEHCQDDPVVPVAGGQELRDKLVEWGGQVSWKEYPTGGHWFNCPDGADDVARFLRDVFHIGRDGQMLSGG